MYCKYCGKQIADDAKFCDGCGKKLIEEAVPVSVPEKKEVRRCPKCGDPVSQYAQMCKNCGCNLTVKNVKTSAENCPKCKGCRIQYQTVVETQPRSFFTIIIYILLACTILGLLIVIPLLLRKRTETVTYAVCQDCGHKWKK